MENSFSRPLFEQDRPLPKLNKYSNCSNNVPATAGTYSDLAIKSVLYDKDTSVNCQLPVMPLSYAVKFKKISH